MFNSFKDRTFTDKSLTWNFCRRIMNLRDGITLSWLRCKRSLLSGKSKQGSPRKNRFKHSETEKERAELERETIRLKAMAEAEGRAHEAKLTEEQNQRMLLDKINGEMEKWLAAINTTFGHIEGMELISIVPESYTLLDIHSFAFLY